MKGKNDRDDENLVRLFGSESRARVLRFLYAFPGQSFYQREILSETGLTLLAVQRELGNLVALGIVKRQETVSRVYYEINRASHLFKPLRDIFAPISAP
jgi:predicted transcriptional regulator